MNNIEFVANGVDQVLKIDYRGYHGKGTIGQKLRDICGLDLLRQGCFLTGSAQKVLSASQ